MSSFDGEEAQARLRREAQHASRLSHPHICHIYDVGRADGQLFVVMELVSGRSLADLMREAPLSIANARRYGMEIADALAHAHEHGITHRDLKSTNVMITPKRGAKVLDFGLARMLGTHQIDALSRSQQSLTGEGTIAGTLPYMAPELLRGQRGDQRSDIWALGVLLYEMVAGHRPFTGATGFEISAGILQQELPALPSTVPAPMRAIVQRCLEKNPDKRYQEAADVHLALEQMKGTRGSQNFRIPFIPKWLLAKAWLFVIGLAVAGLVWYAIGSATIGGTLSNRQGYSMLEEGKFEQAVEEFETLANHSPGEANAWDSLGEGYLANGLPDKSFEAYHARSPSMRISRLHFSAVAWRWRRLAATRRRSRRNRQISEFRRSSCRESADADEAAEVLDKGRREDNDAEVNANALLTLAWLHIERKEYARALDDVRAAERALADRPDHSLLVLADLLGGMAEIRAGNLAAAASRLAARQLHYSRDDRHESNWVAALEGEVALANGRYDQAVRSFSAAQTKAWQTLGHDASTVFAANLPSRDGLARVEIARGNRAAAIAEYDRLTTVGPANPSSAMLEPRHILELARILNAAGDKTRAPVEYARFVALWARADPDLPELSEASKALAALR